METLKIFVIMAVVHSNRNAIFLQDLLPDLPRPRDLRPFPTQEALMFKGHRSIVRCISVHPSGEFLASGSDDQTVKSEQQLLILANFKYFFYLYFIFFKISKTFRISTKFRAFTHTCILAVDNECTVEFKILSFFFYSCLMMP